MNIIIHFPGVCHHEVHVEADIRFDHFWQSFGKSQEELGNFSTPETFFSRFLLFVNGERSYDFTVLCPDYAIVIVIAANKQSLVEFFSQPSVRPHTCSVCASPNVVYLEKCKNKSQGQRPFCTPCYSSFIEEKVFSNIALNQLNDRSIVDIGLSGERDSTLALHFLDKYRTLNQLHFRIVCVFNRIGLGRYDDVRLEAARRIVSGLRPSDQLIVNNIDLPILDDFASTLPQIDICTTKYCNLCVRSSGFRDYGSYIGDDLHIASGGGTIEDKFVDSILNGVSSSPPNGVDFKPPYLRDPRRLRLLDGISEDCLALYSALNSINYCIADCPVSQFAPNYICRKHALNPIKAISPWIGQERDEHDITTSRLVFGLTDGRRIFDYPHAYIKGRTTGGVIDISNKQVATILHPGLTIIPTDRLDKTEEALCRYCEDSESRWLGLAAAELAQALREENLHALIVRFSDGFSAVSNGEIALITDRRQDHIFPISLSPAEKDIIIALQKSPSGVSLSVLLGFDHSLEEMSASIQRLSSRGILTIDDDAPSQHSSVQMNILVIDSGHILNEADCELVSGCFSTNSQSCQTTLLAALNVEAANDDKHYGIVIIIDGCFENIKAMHGSLSHCGFGGKIISIHTAHPMTVYAGCLNCLLEGMHPMTPQMDSPPPFSVLACRVQIIAILSDLCFFEDDNLKHQNTLYYINTVSRNRLKQLIPHRCDQHKGICKQSTSGDRRCTQTEPSCEDRT